MNFLIISFIFLSVSYLRIWMYFNYENYIQGNKLFSIFEIFDNIDSNKKLFLLVFLILPVKINEKHKSYGYALNVLTLIMYAFFILNIFLFFWSN